jgi:hypothetical protein
MAMSQLSLKSLSSHHVHVAGEVCPWCEQPIPEDQSEKIHARIKEREAQQTAEQEARLRREFADKEAEAQKRFEAEKTAAATKAREDAAKESARAIEQIKKGASAREAAIRAEAVQVAEAESAQKLAEANKSAADAVAKLKAAEENKKVEIDKRLAEQRAALERNKTAAVNAERSRIFNEKLKLEEQVKKLQRQLEKKSADELGEGAEIDLLDVLKGAFKNDHIQHVGKGKPGVDVIQDIVLNGKVCGRIVYDSKNRTAWRNDYVAKLRDDQIAAKADYAILSSNVFPAGVKQLHEQDGVIIACPARVLTLVQMLRRIIVQMHTLSLSNRERGKKTAELYQFIRSESCKQLFERIDEHTGDLLELQEKEKKQHDANWQKQGSLYRAIQKTSGSLTSAIDRIIGTAE